MQNETKQKEEFKPSRITIRVKLLTIVSLTIIAALSSMIFLATISFRDHSETLIQEYNLSQARLIGLKTESDFKNLSFSSQFLASLLQNQAISGSTKRLFAKRYFKNNPEYIFFGLAAKKNKGFRFIYSFYNKDFLKLNRLSEKHINKLNKIYGESLLKAFNGITVVENVSTGFIMPALGIALPDTFSTGQLVLVVYLKSGALLSALQSSGENGIFRLMLVNSSGLVIAHSDETEARTASNLKELPIVKKMMTSPVDNGSQKYIYKNRAYLGSYQTISFAHLGVVSTVEAERVFEAVYHIQNQNIKITIIVITLAFLVIFFFSRTLVIPITRLVSATQQVDKGNYEVAITPSTRDEIGVLTNSFLSMARGLQEKEKIKNIFGKFVSTEIADLAMKDELKLGGVSKTCAILFSDLRDFTSISENRKPEKVVELLNDYFSRMVECIHNEDGVVDKFIGDAIMAHWGALYSSENDTKNAINAALQMRGALLELNKSIKTKGGPHLRFGCGINIGTVIAGQIGSERRLEYTVIGDAVNLASRIEYLNKDFFTDILITGYAYERVRGIYRLCKSAEIEIKGKSKPEIVYAVLGRKDDPDAPKNLNELRQLIGATTQRAPVRG